MVLGIDTRLTLLAAGLIFLLSLALGVWKYRQMAVSEDHLAHPYVDIGHGMKRDTTNQFANPAAGVHAGMLALIVAEIGGFTVLLAGFVVAQLL